MTKTELRTNLSNNLLSLMGKSGYSNKHVGLELGISDSALRTYMAGTSIPSVYVACKMADLFGVTIDELVGR